MNKITFKKNLNGEENKCKQVQRKTKSNEKRREMRKNGNYLCRGGTERNGRKEINIT